MAKLPGALELGPAPGAASTRPVGTYDVSPFGRGAAAITDATKALGQGVAKLGEGVGEYALDTSRWEYSKAHADFISRKVELDTATAEDRNYGPDENGKTLPQRYEDKLKTLQDGSAALIQDPRMRERFIIQSKGTMAQGVANWQGHARVLERDADTAYVAQQGDNLINKGVAATDENTRRELIDAHNQLIDGLVAKGAISQVKAVEMKHAWAHQFATADLMAKADSDPEGVVNELRAKPGSAEAVVNRILQIEGTAKNAKSSAQGAGQFIDSTWLDVVKRNRPDLAQGRSDADILALRADRRLGREMTGAYARENGAALEKQGIEATPGNVYLAHFLGPGAAAPVLKANPNAPVSDVLTKAVGAKKAAEMIAANPTILQGQLAGSVKGWADNLMGGAAQGGIYDQLRPDVRQQILARAETNLSKLRQKDDSDQALEKYNVKSLITDDVSSMLATGTGVDAAQPTRIKAVYGDEGVAKWQAAREDARAIWTGTHDLSGLNDAQIDKRLTEIKPKAGQENFDRQQTVYDEVQKQVTVLRKRRDEDPAGSVAEDPIVTQAREKYDQAKPETFRAVAQARLAAQEKAGIAEDNRSPITKQEALALTVPLRRMLPGQERETLTDLAKQFQQMFGEDADTAFTYALRVYKVDAATSQAAARVMRKLNLGETVSEEEARKADHDTELQAAGRAMMTTAPDARPGQNPGRLMAQAAAGQAGPANAAPAAQNENAPATVPPAADIVALRRNPALAARFDAKYGNGTSKKILDQFPTGTPGQKPPPFQGAAAQNADEGIQQNALTDFFGRITGSEKKPEVIRGDAPTGYPTAEDAAFARANAFSYGKDWEPFFNNATAKIIGQSGPTTKKGAGEFRPQSMAGRSLSEAFSGSSETLDLTNPQHAAIKEDVQDLFARAALATNRDPIASLGFAPSKTMIDVVLKNANIAGLYSPKEDTIYSNLTTQSNIVHESVHRGVEQLRKRSPEAEKILKDAPFSEETLVRYIMATTMGDPEKGSGSIADKQRKAALYVFDEQFANKPAQKALARLREIAAEEIAKQHPGGPR